jgi:membrane-associated phospholipid phosphatase
MEMTSHKAWLLWSAAVALAVYALMWIAFVLQWNWLTCIDSSALGTLHGYGVEHPTWVLSWNVLCTVLGPTAFRLLALVVIIVALARRNLRVALFLVICVELSGLVIEIAKLAADRPRPASALVAAPATAFPSGHAVGGMIGVLALLTVLLPVVSDPLRAWLIALGAVGVIAVGVGRVVLNVHHPSDVIAGWALGYAYFVACLLMVPPTQPVTVTDETPAAPGTAH